MIVRPCEEGDTDALARMALTMGRADSMEQIRVRARRLLERPDHCLCVAVRHGRPAGYAWAQNYGPHLRSGEAVVRIHDLFVEPGERRSGIGRALFEHVRHWAAQQGAVYLQWQASQDALAFDQALDLTGDPCPDPDHPFFELILGAAASEAGLSGGPRTAGAGGV